jgi:hypothetical protein
MEYPRPLTDNEAAILTKLLQDDRFAGAAAYRSQLPHLTVTGGCPCGCATIDLQVDRDAPVGQGPAGSPLPVEGVAADPADAELPLELLIFTEDGFLAMLEIVYYGEPPSELPPSDAVEVVIKRER